MKDLNSTRLRFQKFEFWAATAVLAIALITLVLEVNEDPEPSHNFFRALIHFYTNYMGEAAAFVTLYLSFLLLNFYVVPRLIRKESLSQNIALTIVTFAVIGLVFGNMDVIFPAVIIFLIYSLAKYGGLYLWVNSETIESKYRFFAPGSFIACVVWLISMFLFFAGDADGMAIAAWALFFPLGLFIYSYSFFFSYTKIAKP